QLGVVEPHAGEAVADAVAQQIDVAPGEISVEIAEQRRDERHERLTMLVGAHPGELVEPDACGGMSQYIGALQRATHAALADRREHTSVDEARHMTVEARGGYVGELGPQ